MFNAILASGEAGSALSTISGFMTEFTTFFSGLLGNVGTVVTTIIENPILVFPTMLTFSGMIIGIVKGLKN